MTIPRYRLSRLLLSILLLASPIAAHAQEDPHAACAAVGWVPREVLERPLTLRDGVGNAREKVTTASPEAQAFYDQGLNYLHGYVWIEAARSFHQALRLDSDIAMAHVGLSYVFSGLDDPDAANKALERAQALAPKLSEHERRRIAVRAKHLEALGDLANPAKHLEYKKAIDQALSADIGDPTLWLLRGNAEEASAAGRGQRGGVASTAFYHQALAVAPDNGAAHHYLTHSYETIGRIPEALAHGEAYARLAPSIPHSHHMWGHDLRRVGRIDDAIAAFQKTLELERAYYAAESIPPGLDWHHGHNLDLLATSFQHQGRMRRAEELMREAAALPAVSDYREFNRKELAVFFLGRARWKDALASARQLTEGRFAATRAVGNALAGHALLALGRREEGKASLAAAEKEVETIPRLVTGISIGASSVQPYVDALRGELWLRTDRKEEGRALLKDVQRAIRAVPGPDAWTQALFRLETIAHTARDVGDWDLAEHSAREMLDHDPAYAGTHFALALVAEHRGDREAATAELVQAERYWRSADGDLPELTQVRKRRAESLAPSPHASVPASPR